MTRPASNGPRLVSGAEGRHLWQLSAPMALGLLSLNSYSIADIYFVGQLGTLELAAMTFTFPVSFSLVAIGLGVGNGVSSVLSRRLGAGEIDTVQRITTHALILGAVLGLCVMVTGLATIDPVFTMLGAGAETLPLIREYMEVFYFGGFLLVLPMIGNFAMRAAGDPRIPAVVLTTSAVINIVLDPILIFGWFGVPRLELQGAALATVFANGTSVLASIAILHWREHLIRARYLGFTNLVDSWRRLLHIGVPVMASNLLNPVTVGVITSFVSVYGPAAVGGFGVASRVEALIMIVVFAVTSSAGPFTGQNYGAGRVDRIRRFVGLSEAFCIAYTVAVAVVLWIAAGPLTRLFNADPDVVAVARLYLSIVPIALGGFGVMLVAVTSFNALGRPVPATLLTFVKLFLGYIPLAWLLSWAVGLEGIFWANAVAHVVFGVVGFIWLRRMLRACEAGPAVTAPGLRRVRSTV